MEEWTNPNAFSSHCPWGYEESLESEVLNQRVVVAVVGCSQWFQVRRLQEAGLGTVAQSASSGLEAFWCASPGNAHPLLRTWLLSRQSPWKYGELSQYAACAGKRLAGQTPHEHLSFCLFAGKQR